MSDIVTSQNPSTIVEIITPGPQGPAGPQGKDGAEDTITNVTYDDGLIQFDATGSLAFSGSVNISDITSSLVKTDQTSSMSVATASYALNAVTSSYIENAISASYALEASNATSSSYALEATSASYALEASNADNATSSSYALEASNATSASYALEASNADNAISSSYSLTSSYVEVSQTASYIIGSNVDGAVDLANEADSLAINATGTNLSLSGDLTVAGTASFTNATNLAVTDKYILLASGSATPTDGGIVIEQAANGIGKIFGYDNNSSRWGITGSFNSNTAAGFTPDAYMSLVVDTNNINDIDTQYEAPGNIFINASNVPYIYTNKWEKIILSGSNAELNSITTGNIVASNISASGNISASFFAGNGSNIIGVISSSYANTSSYAVTASYALEATSADNAISASYALNSSTATTASYALEATSADTAISASYALDSSTTISASYALSSSQATTALTASSVLGSISITKVVNVTVPTVNTTRDPSTGNPIPAYPNAAINWYFQNGTFQKYTPTATNCKLRDSDLLFRTNKITVDISITAISDNFNPLDWELRITNPSLASESYTILAYNNPGASQLITIGGTYGNFGPGWTYYEKGNIDLDTNYFNNPSFSGPLSEGQLELWLRNNNTNGSLLTGCHVTIRST